MLLIFNPLGGFIKGMWSMAKRCKRGERAGEGGRGRAAAGRAEAQGLRAQAERAARRLWHTMSFTQHASTAQLWRSGPAPTAKAPIHPESAALRPWPHWGGKKITRSPPNTHHVMFMLGVLQDSSMLVHYDKGNTCGDLGNTRRRLLWLNSDTKV